MKYQELFEPRGKYESLKHYQIRVRNIGKQYEKLKGIDQKFIIAAKEDGFHWRGDDMDFFRKAYDEFMKYKAMTPDDQAEYRRRALAGLQ